MHVCLVSPAWRRFDVTRLALAQRAHLRGVLAGRGHEVTGVVVADDDNLDIAREYGFETVERDNTFLGRKFNDGLERALDMGAEVVVLIGSDDWVHPDVFDRMPLAESEVPVPSLEEPAVTWNVAPEIVSGRWISFVDMATGRIRMCQSGTRSGSIPWLIHRDALTPSGGRPIRETQQKGTDFALVAGLNVQPTWVFHDPNPVARVDFKTSVNLNDFDITTGILEHSGDLDALDVLGDYYPAELVEMARDTMAVLA